MNMIILGLEELGLLHSIHLTDKRYSQRHSYPPPSGCLPFQTKEAPAPGYPLQDARQDLFNSGKCLL